MVTKLKSVLTNPISRLLFKAALVGFTFLWSPIAAALFSLWFYFRPLFYAFNYLSLFIIWLAMLFWLPVNWMTAVFLSFLFFILIGLKDLLLIEKSRWRLVLSFSLFYLVFINFFLLDKSSFFTLKWLVSLLLILFLFNYIFKLFLPELIGKLGIISLIATLIIGEFFWVISWLPLGFLNAANLMALLTFLVSDLIIHYYRRSLGKRLLIKDSILFIVLFLFILLTSQWTI